MSSYIDQVSSLGPKIWYRFNETAGTPVNSGSLSTTSTFSNLLLNEQTDVDGRAIYLNGSNARIQLPAHPAFSLFNDRSFTVECWVQINNADTNTTGPFEIFRLNPASSPHNVISLTVGGTSGNRGKVLLNSAWTTQLTSTNAIDDGTWHHIVYTYNTSSVKLYIDGVLDQSTTPSSLPASFVYDESTKKLIGAGYVGISQTTIGQYLKARIDEFAAYDYELTAQNIIDNYNAGASVEFASDVLGTASALMVDPTLTVDYIETHAPMTADASFPLPNQTSYPEMLVAKMETYNLEAWLKFDSNRYNYGTGGTIRSLTVAGSAELGLPGPCGMYAGKSLSSVGEGYIALDDPNNNILSKINDKVYSLGVWFKIPSSAGASNKRVLHLAGANTTARTEIFVDTNGYIQFQYRTSAGTNNYTGSTNLKDDTWHYAAMRVNSTDVRYYLDGVEVSALTVTGTKSSAFLLQFGNIGSDGFSDTSPYYVSNFYVAGHTEIDATDIDEIWDVGNQTLPIQAYAEMPQSSVRFNNAYNYKVEDLEANVDLRYDNATGTTPNFGLAGNLNYGEFNFNLGTFQGTKLNPTKNRYAYYIDDADDAINISGPFDASDNTNTYNLFARFNTLTTGEQWYAQIGNSFDPNTFSGYVIGADSDGPFFMGVDDQSDNSTWTTYHTNDTTLFDSYHLYTIVRDGSSAKFYIDGKLFDTYTPTGDDNVNEINLNAKDYMNLSGWDTSVVSHTYQGWYLDEFQTFDYALSAQEVFELWQSLTIDGPGEVNASFPLPTFEAGFGPTINADPHTASADIVNPESSAETNELAIPMDAFAEFILPNFGGNVVIDANYGHTAFEASALFHDPQFQIGEVNAVASMDASAEFLDGILIIAGGLSVPPMIALDATLVDPGIVTIKGGLVNASPMTANAFSPIPPAYFTLQDDKWYLRLFAQHTTPNIEDAFITASTTTAATQIAKTFLKFFNNETLSIAPGSIEKLENNLTVNDANDLSASPAANLTPAPLMSPGFFDDQGRKAVLFENIEFEIDEEVYNSRKPYSLEFSIKTTKANQIVAKGKWRSFTGNQRAETGLGLYNGKLYIMQTNTTTGTIGDRTPHPSNPDVGGTSTAIIGNKNVADGQWHHVIVQQGYEDNRIQIWVDGQLDRQYIGVVYSRPYILGNNSGNATYRSEFYTSAWSYDKQEFLSEYDVSLNYIGYLQYEPVKAAAMLATANIGNHKAQGNRGRALLLYWWPVTGLGDVNDTDRGQNGYFDESTFDKEVLTVDYIEQPPQEWYGWDLYPVDINGRYVSDLVKIEAYGGAENIRLNVTNPGARQPLTIKENRRGYFRDPISDARRYIDLVNDIDLSNFDAIFFRNYPDQSRELDNYAREEFSDSYFNLRERELYDDFVKSVRAAVDQGLSLFVSNTQLAIDLGIIDRVEEVSDLYDVENETDPYTPTQLPAEASVYLNNGVFLDTWRNNKLRVVNTIPELTGDASYIFTDAAYFKNDDALDYGGPNRPFYAYDYRANGLQVGDEFIYANYHPEYAVKYQAVPFDNVKCGTIITAFANTVRNGLTEITNPYKDYATSIAVQPGDILNGSPVKGKIFVNFTERLSGETFGFISRKINSAAEVGYVDLATDYWINKAFEENEITETKKNELIASASNLDRKLENNQITQDQYNILTRWDSNGQYIVSQKNLIDEDVQYAFERGKAFRTRYNKQGIPTTTAIPYGGQLWTFKYSRQFPTLIIDTMTMLTRGIRWLSNRTEDVGLVIRTEAMTASVTAVNPDSVVADRDNSVNAPSLIASATIIDGVGYTLTDRNIAPLPMFADGSFGDFVKNVDADPMTATANFREVRAAAVEVDEIVVYIAYVEPILYLREDIIK